MSKLLSIKNTLLLVIFTFFSMAIATYIENSQSKKSAWEVVYSSFWFELLFYFIIIVLVFNIFKFKMYKKKTIPTFIFHLAFIFIIFGALITKYYGYQGQMYIPLNETTNKLISNKDFLQVKTLIDNKEINIIKEGIENFEKKITIQNRFLELKNKHFVPFGKQEILADRSSGFGAMSFEVLKKNKREKYFLENQHILKIDDINIYFNMEVKDTKNKYIKIDALESKRLQFISNIDIVTNFEEKLEKNNLHELSQGIIYKINNTKILINKITSLGKLDFVEDENGVSAFIVDVNYNGKTKELALIQDGKLFMNLKNKIYFDNTYFDISFGKKFDILPFSIKLNQYKLETYPGSANVFTYESFIELNDGKETITDSIKINKPLTYGFFTIFQTKYENHNATLLEINYNPGKWFIYIGYILLTLGLILNLFNPNSRFRELLSSTK